MIKQKDSLEDKLNQSQTTYQQIEHEIIDNSNMLKALLQSQDLNGKENELKAELEKEIIQLEGKLNNEKQIKAQLNQALQFKENKINELERKLIYLDQERIGQLKAKERELIEIKKELVNKLTRGEDTKEIHKEKQAKKKELNEIRQELMETSASCDANRKKQILNQANNFLKAKNNFLISRGKAIKKLQECYNNLEGSTNKGRHARNEIIGDGVTSLGKSIPVAGRAFCFLGDMVNIENKISKVKFANKRNEEFQSILLEYNEAGLFQLNNDHIHLTSIIQENEDLKISQKIKDIFKLDLFDINEYKIFKYAANSWEGNREFLDSITILADITSLRNNLNELKSELRQQEKEFREFNTNE